MDIIPNTVVGAFASRRNPAGAVLRDPVRVRLAALGEHGQAGAQRLRSGSHALFGVVGIIMKAAPLGAFGAMAFTIGKYGIATLLSLAMLMVAFYATC